MLFGLTAAWPSVVWCDGCCRLRGLGLAPTKVRIKVGDFAFLPKRGIAFSKSKLRQSQVRRPSQGAVCSCVRQQLDVSFAHRGDILRTVTNVQVTCEIKRNGLSLCLSLRSATAMKCANKVIGP
jgi:hypothetical protein